jgi:hypothetical protein
MATEFPNSLLATLQLAMESMFIHFSYKSFTDNGRCKYKGEPVNTSQIEVKQLYWT